MRASIARVVVLAALLLPGCPGRNEALRDGGSSPFSEAGSPFEGTIELHDEAVRALDPGVLAATSTPCRAPVLGVVSHIVDGDTVDVEHLSDGTRVRVRMIGVDTPELAHDDQPEECFGPEATDFTRQLLGHSVWLTYDAGCQDTFGRDLAYVWIGPSPGDMWNRQLAARGFARTLTIPPNTSNASVLEQDRAAAQSAGRGLWSACD